MQSENADRGRQATRLWVRGVAVTAGRGLAVGLLAVVVNPVLFALSVISLALVPALGLGLLLFPAVTAAVRWRTGLARRFAGWSGVQIPAPYLPAPERPGRWRQLRWLATDAATWRDLLWLVPGALIGGVTGLLTAGLPAYGVEGLILPVALFPFGTGYGWGPIWPIDTVAKALVCPPMALLVLIIGVLAGPRLLRLEARFTATLLRPTVAAGLRLRVSQLTRTRAETVDAQAAELRRIERDLHDGAQARMVSLSMSIGLAEELLKRDPDSAAQLLADARTASGEALVELRTLVRGIHPPVLAERGLAGAVQALAMALPLPVAVEVDLPGRLAAPVESAVYFVVAEALTNIARHSGASTAWIRLRYIRSGSAPGDGAAAGSGGAGGGRLLVEVGDDGVGGADPAHGSGLVGMERRLAAFDGIMTVTSPLAGPTVVTMELPCELSSPRTSPSSATG